MKQPPFFYLPLLEDLLYELNREIQSYRAKPGSNVILLKKWDHRMEVIYNVNLAIQSFRYLYWWGMAEVYIEAALKRHPQYTSVIIRIPIRKDLPMDEAFFDLSKPNAGRIL